MKLKSLILGSVAAAGLSTAGFAADLGVLTSLDVCDSLGLSGLTISSDTNCLQITGGVSYEFNWGDYRRSANFDALPTNPYADADDGTNDFPVNGSATNLVNGDTEWLDYESKVEAWLKVVGTADSDFGPAKAVIGFKQVSRYRTLNAGWTATDSATVPLANGSFGQGVNGDSTNGLELSEAYVSVGDSTVLTAGMRVHGKDGSVANLDDDTPFNYLGTFGSSITDAGLLFKDGAYIFGGASIQVQSDLGNGLSVGVGLENLDNTDGNSVAAGGNLTPAVQNSENAGTLVGVVNYAGEGVTAHLTGGAIGVLDGSVESWFAHVGATGSYENFKVRAALAYLNDDTFGVDRNYLQGLLSGSATFDMFTVALSAEYKSTEGLGLVSTGSGWGFGGSISAALTDTISLNLGGRYFNSRPNFAADFDQWQIEAGIAAALTETIKASAAVGIYGGDVVEASLDPAGAGAGLPNLSGDDTAFYGSAGFDWTPAGGGFTAGVKGLVTSEGAYKATFKATKSFE